MLSTAADEGGQFIEKQVEVGEPILKTVGNISDTIGSSEFVQGVGGGARSAPGLVGRTASLALSTAQVDKS